MFSSHSANPAGGLLAASQVCSLFILSGLMGMLYNIGQFQWPSSSLPGLQKVSKEISENASNVMIAGVCNSVSGSVF